jgi:hypothetical protein
LIILPSGTIPALIFESIFSETMSDTPTTGSVRIKYESEAALYASQVILSSNQEDIILDFSSGLIKGEGGTDERIMPIHSRIALTRTGAARLHQLLERALNPGGK